MNKDNIFKSSSFYMAEGDVLHMIIIGEDGTFPLVILQGEDVGDVPGIPTIAEETNVTSVSFSANWLSAENATGYYLDVSTDALFEYFVAGFENKDVSGVNTYSVTGLAENTTYYYRVRAYNDYGASASSDSEAVTTDDVAGLVDLDGNEYTTVRIGNQEWITTNLAVTKYADGSNIPNVTDNDEWANGIDGSNMTKSTYGALYNWYAATYNTGGASIAPSGWHVPTKADLESLGVNGTATGNALATVGADYWFVSSNATNSKSFSARGAGVRVGTVGSFSAIKEDTGFWSTLENDATTCWEGALIRSTNDLYYQVGFQYKTAGRSIRLVKDDSVDPGTMTDYDGNTYATVVIGTRVWMSTNLKVEHYNNGTAIPRVTDSSAWSALTTGAFCYYNNAANEIDGFYCWYDNDIANKADYGALYNWYAVDVDPSDSKDIAYLERDGVQEAGWRVPAEADLTELSTYLGGDALGAIKLKEVGDAHWISPYANGTDEFGFAAVPTGYRSYTDGGFNDMGYVVLKF